VLAPDTDVVWINVARLAKLSFGELFEGVVAVDSCCEDGRDLARRPAVGQFGRPRRVWWRTWRRWERWRNRERSAPLRRSDALMEVFRRFLGDAAEAVVVELRPIETSGKGKVWVPKDVLRARLLEF